MSPAYNLLDRSIPVIREIFKINYKFDFLTIKETIKAVKALQNKKWFVEIGILNDDFCRFEVTKKSLLDRLIAMEKTKTIKNQLTKISIIGGSADQVVVVLNN